MLRTLARVALIPFAAAALAACGGGDGDGLIGGDANRSLRDPIAFAQNYLATSIGLLSGSADSSKMLVLFEDSCRSGVQVADVNRAIEEARLDYPKLKGAKIEAIDFSGKATVKQDGATYTVTYPAASEMKLRIDGRTVNAGEYLNAVGFETSPRPGEVDLIKANDRFYVKDCDELTSLVSDVATPTPRAGTPARPGATPTRSAGATATRPAGGSTPGTSSVSMRNYTVPNAFDVQIPNWPMKEMAAGSGPAGTVAGVRLALDRADLDRQVPTSNRITIFAVRPPAADQAAFLRGAAPPLTGTETVRTTIKVLGETYDVAGTRGKFTAGSRSFGIEVNLVTPQRPGYCCAAYIVYENGGVEKGQKDPGAEFWYGIAATLDFRR